MNLQTAVRKAEDREVNVCARSKDTVSMKVRKKMDS